MMIEPPSKFDMNLQLPAFVSETDSYVMTSLKSKKSDNKLSEASCDSYGDIDPFFGDVACQSNVDEYRS